MPSDIWTQTDQGPGVLVDVNGAPWYCTQCPCADTQAAIKERQYAYGITNLWSAGDSTNVANLIATSAEKDDYTLLQLKAYVNAIADTYLDGGYSGGPSTPTLLTSTYANSATTATELLALVLLMLETFDDQISSRSSPYFAGSANGESTCAAAKTAAEADWQSVGGFPQGQATTFIRSNGSSDWDATILAAAGIARTSGMTTEVAHVVKTYGFAQAPSVPSTFHKYGRDVADEDEYGLQDTSAEISTAVYTTGSLLPLTMPDSWPACPAVGATIRRGVHLGIFISVIDWSFDNQ